MHSYIMEEWGLFYCLYVAERNCFVDNLWEDYVQLKRKSPTFLTNVGVALKGT